MPPAEFKDKIKKLKTNEISPVIKKRGKCGAVLACKKYCSLFPSFWKEGFFYALELFMRAVA